MLPYLLLNYSINIIMNVFVDYMESSTSVVYIFNLTFSEIEISLIALLDAIALYFVRLNIQSFNLSFSEIGISLNCTFRCHCIAVLYKRDWCLYFHIWFLLASNTVLTVLSRCFWFWLVSFLICFRVCISLLLFSLYI